MTSKELRKKYINFFKKEGHIEIPSSSLIPENDPSTLFISAGMQPLTPFLLGEKHPAGKRLVNSQKCIRTGDIDEVGDKTHLTFFEMLGHWSLGDYWKKDALKMTYEFLTQGIGLDKNRLGLSVYKYGKDVPVGFDEKKFDKEAFDIWRSLDISEKRIQFLEKENWWEPIGKGGPCGPCTEYFYWADNLTPAPKKFDSNDKHWVEISNDVLMEYEKIGENKYKSAQQKNIDNGTGMERLLAVINGLDDNYLTDLFKPIIEKIEELSNKEYVCQTQQNGSRYEPGANITRSMRIIADHIRAATFIMGDDLGIAPSNTDQGYVVRKLIRRAIRHGKLLGINDLFCFKISEVAIKIMKDVYPELKKNKEFIIEQLAREEEKFSKCLQNGLKELEKEIKKLRNKEIKGDVVFNLFQTHGFPLELTQELAKEKGLTVDEKSFKKELEKHQELSRTASVGKFKGGLADQSEQMIKYHTATHLLQAALRQVLGSHVKQKGSNITEKRLRFDFSYDKKMTENEIKQVEDIINNYIQQDIPVKCEEISLKDAKNRGATGLFVDKYGDKVKVYTICLDMAKPISCEICAGPHVDRTGKLSKFKIIKEESSSAGVRRIKAILE